MHIADYITIGILIGCMISAGVMALHKARWQIDHGGGKRRGEEGISSHFSKPSTFLMASKTVVSGFL